LEPLVLPPNQLHRFYRGGRRISSLRSSSNDDPYAPEEWIASMASPFGEPGVGIAVLPDGTPLPDAIASDPEGFLGPHHVARFGPDVAVLIKLLDAGERLPVHLHPDDDFARANLASQWGKTEAWIILEAEPEAAVQVGFRQPIDLETLAVWVASQDGDALLSSLNRVTVAAGDTIFVPAGTPHAIGEGILLAELQQPTDFSLLLEWKGFAPDTNAASLGLGFDLALQAVNLEPWSEADLTHAATERGSNRAGVSTLFPADADPFFRAERVGDGANLEQGFSVLLVAEGTGELRSDDWKLDVATGDAILIPYSAGACALEGSASALRCMPPDPRSAR
jgi:mannose-6-phosphate isomerase